MKNLLIFVNPSKEFGSNYEWQAKVQIDHSLNLGWKEEDIVLATNFPYEYRGVKSLLVDDSCWNDHRHRASKVNTICYLFDHEMIKDDLYWFHDLDAYQLHPLNVDLEGKDAGFVTYSSDDYLTNWNSGSFFFYPQARDMFGLIKNTMDRYRCQDEQALCILARKNKRKINSRYKLLNCTYNFCRIRDTLDLYGFVDKPIRVIHFDPRVEEVYNEVKPTLSDELIELFKRNLF